MITYWKGGEWWKGEEEWMYTAWWGREGEDTVKYGRVENISWREGTNSKFHT